MRTHISANIEGALKMKDEELDRCFTGDDGNELSGQQARQMLLKMKSEGKRLVPSNGCDNFDFQKGCLGHQD